MRVGSCIVSTCRTYSLSTCAEGKTDKPGVKVIYRRFFVALPTTAVFGFESFAVVVYSRHKRVELVFNKLFRTFACRLGEKTQSVPTGIRFSKLADSGFYDIICRTLAVNPGKFQSTHPARGETAKVHKLYCGT